MEQVVRQCPPHNLNFWCPGCNGVHGVSVVERGSPKGWTWNGSMDKPTFSPSVLVTYNGLDAGEVDEDGNVAPAACCHSFVVDGKIQFLSDCTHDLKDQTVDLPDISNGYPRKTTGD